MRIEKELIGGRLCSCWTRRFQRCFPRGSRCSSFRDRLFLIGFGAVYKVTKSRMSTAMRMKIGDLSVVNARGRGGLGRAFTGALASSYIPSITTSLAPCSEAD